MASRKSDPKQFEGRTGSPGKGQEEGRLERARKARGGRKAREGPGIRGGYGNKALFLECEQGEANTPH